MSRIYLMRRIPVARFTFAVIRTTAVTMAACLTIAGLSTCQGDEGPSTPGPGVYDPTRPTIVSFSAKRGAQAVADGVVFSGEDITLVVEAVSHALPVSCGLTEDEVVEGNLTYSFFSTPPDDIPAPGFVVQPTPPSSEALWRVPNLDLYDEGEGLVYTIRVTVSDKCLGNKSEGLLSLRAFSNEGPPIVSAVTVQSKVDTVPAIEAIDANGFYEVEEGDACRVTVTAQSRTSSSICSNRGVAQGQELEYAWATSIPAINPTFDSDPAKAKTVDFDVPVSVSAGDSFNVECTIEDVCTGVSTILPLEFIVVGAPEIKTLSGTADGSPLHFDPFFATNLVLPGDDITLTATAEIMDPSLCDEKGIHPGLLWEWDELIGSIPSITPEFKPFPLPNETSVAKFIVPAASNGTEYSLQCKVSDQCNGLSDIELEHFTVIVPPQAGLASVKRNSATVTADPGTGRYEVLPGDVIEIRVTATAASNSTFCGQRGVSASPPVRYTWTNPLNLLVLNYSQEPGTGWCDLLVVVPSSAPPSAADLRCTVEDLCNGLTAGVQVPFRVLEDGE
jgi:hypothetical protein